MNKGLNMNIVEVRDQRGSQIVHSCVQEESQEALNYLRSLEVHLLISHPTPWLARRLKCASRYFCSLTKGSQITCSLSAGLKQDTS